MDDFDGFQSQGDDPGSEGWWSSLLTHIENDGVNAPEQREQIEKQGDGVDIDWRRLEQDMQAERIFTCEVIGYNRGGLLVAHRDLRGFVPLSHLLSGSSSPATIRFNELMGHHIRLRVIECDRVRTRVVLSERAAQAQEGARDQLLSRIIKNQRVRGQVTHITKFGLFVDIGGVEGLVHISELSWGRVSHPREYAAVGDEIEALVIDVDKARGRVALSRKQLKSNPWEKVDQHFEIGQLRMGEITEIVRYGAFVRLEDGIEGLLHKSKMPLPNKQSPREMLQRGQHIEVHIIAIDADNQRISLALASDRDHLEGEA